MTRATYVTVRGNMRVSFHPEAADGRWSVCCDGRSEDWDSLYELAESFNLDIGEFNRCAALMEPAPDPATSEPARARCFARHPQGRTLAEIERACDACAGEVGEPVASFMKRGKGVSIAWDDERLGVWAATLADGHHPLYAAPQDSATPTGGMSEREFVDAARADADEVRRIVKELLPHPALRSLDGMQVEFIVQETLRSAARVPAPAGGSDGQ